MAGGRSASSLLLYNTLLYLLREEGVLTAMVVSNPRIQPPFLKQAGMKGHTSNLQIVRSDKHYNFHDNTLPLSF